MTPKAFLDQVAAMSVRNDCLRRFAENTRHRPDRTTVRTIPRPGFSLTGAVLSAGSGGFEELLLLDPEMFVVNASASADGERRRRDEGDGLVEFCFRLAGSAKRRIGPEPEFTVPAGSFLISRLRSADTQEVVVASRERDDTVAIFCTVGYLERCFGAFTATLRPDLATLFSEVCALSWNMRVTTYPRLAGLVQQLFLSHFTTAKRLVHAEGLVRMIICEILAVLENAQEDCAIVQPISDEDFVRLHKARDYLVAHHTPPPSINELAREVGLSATKLKLGFKSLFGKSVFAYAQSLRMNLARELLSQHKLSIQNISADLGYEYQHSFTVAFRRHFGVLPKTYRRDPASYADLIGERADEDRAFGVFRPLDSVVMQAQGELSPPA